MPYKFNPSTGHFSYAADVSFSIRHVQSGCVLCIPENQQMTIKKNIVIDGELIILGELVII